MDILLLSDLHFELHRDHGAEFLKRLNTKAEVLVLAGDICGGWMLPEVMGKFCAKYSRVVLTHGNHEFYRSSRPEVIKFTERACRQNRNLYWLDCKTATIDGIKFHGTPLWFKEAPLAPKHEMNDFTQIEKFESWVYSENQRAVEYLTKNVEKGDVVVTHYLPTNGSVAPQYRGNPLNPFFLCDVEGLIRIKEPALWCHGHTHASFDYQVGETRVVCNPLGYGSENWRDFDPTKIIQVF
jgi:Icc-related predicted phosphoesterase